MNGVTNVQIEQLEAMSSCFRVLEAKSGLDMFGASPQKRRLSNEMLGKVRPEISGDTA